MIARVSRWVDDRLGLSRFARTSLNKIFPDHWSFMIGEIAMYCFVILLLTGTYLTFFFNPSTQDVVYHGSYKPLQGVHLDPGRDVDADQPVADDQPGYFDLYGKRYDKLGLSFQSK